VLLPAHDAAATLGPCLASLARQTLADWECVLADDGSTDGTLERARSLCAGDPRFTGYACAAGTTSRGWTRTT
jgi:CDP-glycerol glycerophosphotransferase